MKKMIELPALLVGLMLLFVGTTQTAKAQQEDVSLQSFYDELSPYGTWIQDPQYGYVWRPDVDQEEFRPYYTNGRWAMTEYGNTWVSNYDWGWAPFHYGRWVYNRYNNWVWLPDTIWGPAWVSWRSGGGYYGWAPLGPSISIGINIGRGGYRVPDICWNFIPYNNIYYNSYPSYNYRRNRVYIQNTVIINNTYVRNSRTYYTGPRAEEVRRYTNQNVTVYNINRTNRAGAARIDNNTVNIYNPRPSRSSINNNEAAPRGAIQGNINRGVVSGRDANLAVNRRDIRSENGNATQADRNGISDRGNGNSYNRPSRGEVNDTQGRNDNNNASITPRDDRDRAVHQRPSVFDRRSEMNNPSQRPDRNQSSESQAQQVERNRDLPQQQNEQQQQRAERQREVFQQRIERSQQAPQQRVERPQPTQQAQPQQQRVESSQSAPSQRPQRGSGGSESRAESRGSTGRPGRG